MRVSVDQKQRWLHLAVACFLFFVCQVFAASTARAQNKVIDGNFEEDTPFTDPADIANQYQVFSTARQMTYWKVTTNTVDKHQGSYLGLGCPPGGLDHHIDLNPAGSIEQMMYGLAAGTKYTLSFYTRVHANVVVSCPSTGSATMQVDVRDAAGNLLHDILVLTKADAGWARRSYEFVATADTALLRFSGTGSCTGGGGVLIDRAEVIASGTDPCVPYVHFAYAGKDTSFCSINGMAEIRLKASGGVSYSWSPGIYFADSTAANAVAKIDATTTFVVTVVNEFGCTDKDTVVATIYPAPTVAADPAWVSGCVNSNVPLSVTGAVKYAWSPSEGLDADKSANPVLTISGDGRYIVTGTDEHGCMAKDTVQVTAYPAPDLEISADRSRLDCFHNTALLTASGAEQYQWEPAQYCDRPSEDATYARPTATTVFTLTGINHQGCKATDTITLFLQGESLVRMPNVFTPNGDRLNDEAKPVLYCDFILQEFSIYNRAGKRVFVTSDLQKGWDGSFNGAPCDANVYFYMIRGRDSNGGDVIAKGDIILMR